MQKLPLLLCALLGAGGPLLADTRFTDLTAQERAAFHAEIRALLLADPTIITRALRPPSPYEDAVASDLSVIGRHANTLFANGAQIAIFVSKDCVDCARAVDELRTLTQENGVGFTVFDLSEQAEMTSDLGLDTAPSYVLRDKMVRGHVPPVVLRRYLQP